MKHAAQCIPVEYQLMLLAIMHSVCVEILSDLKILMMRVPLQIAFFLNLGSILASVITGWKLVELNTVAFSNYADKLEEVNPIPRWLHEKNHFNSKFCYVNATSQYGSVSNKWNSPSHLIS